jgi:predicted metal-dependent phosphotriesterase family hydrolase
MRRRDFLQVAGGVMAAACLRAAPEPTPAIETVTGPVPVADLGPTLSHEHVLVDFVGADQVSPARYDVEAVAAVVRPHLLRARELGFRTLFECTPAYLARDPVLLRRLSLETGLRLVTNTGLYGVRNNRFLPPYALEETAEQLSRRWIREALDGIEGTGIRPGFIKCGVDPAPELSTVHARLVDAAGLTHRETGLTIAVHTGRGPGLEQIDRLRSLGVAPAAFVWVHAQGAPDDAIAAAAEQGAWVSFDGVNRASLLRHRNLCGEMKRRGLLGRVLLSHDAGWFDPAKPGGGEFRGYDLMSTALLPLLREDGFGERDIDLLLVENPAAAFSPRRRLTG